MQLTFTEMHTPTVGLQIQVDRQLYTEQSDFQRIDVFECEEFGRFLTLDGYMMLTERDEFIYHEMMVHVPMAVLGEKIKKVLVIGGGDTGNDCVGTSIRQGAVAVTQLEMMPKLPETRAANNPWPEWPRVLKTDYGQQEAIAKFGHDPRIYETTVKEIVKNKDGQVCAAKCVKLAWEKDPETGRMNMKEIPDSEYTIECDLILIAAGFLGTQKYVADAFGVKLNARTNVETAPGEHKTNVDKVYTCGDMHRGQSLVVWAIREGRDAAKEVDTFLNGYSNDF